MTKYRITLTEEQMRLAADAIEDWSRFLAGQCELFNATSMLEQGTVLQDALSQLQPLVTPELIEKFGNRGASYAWNGGDCPNERQRKAIAVAYYIYRTMLHNIAVANDHDNVYSSPSLRCELQGEPIEVEIIKDK